MASKNEKNTFESTVDNLFKGMDEIITTKTVVGDAIRVDDTIVIPLVDVSFGIGAGAFGSDKKDNSAGGISGKITPSSVLVIQNGTSKMVSVKGQDNVNKILDMVPDVLNKFIDHEKKSAKDSKVKEKKSGEKTEETAKASAAEPASADSDDPGVEE